MEPIYLKVASTFGLVKGLLLAAVLGWLDVGFWKSLVLVVVAAVIGFAGSITSAWYTVRESRKNRQIVRDVQRQVGADRREGDAPED